MRRSANALLWGGLTALVLLARPSHSQSLDSELPIEIRAELLPRSGSAPMVTNCDLAKDDIVECTTDRKIKKVECRFEGPDAPPLKGKITATGFLCQAPGDKRELLTSLGVYLLSDDLNFSEWIIRVASPQQLTRMYKAEMETAFQAKPLLPPYELGASGMLFIGGVGDNNLYYGITSRMDFFKSLFGRIDYYRPLTQGRHKRFDDVRASLGYKQPILGWLGVEIDFAFHALGTSDIKNLKAGELGVAVTGDLLPGFLAASGFVRNQWPEVQTLRQSVQAGGRAEFGPFFTHWRIDAAGGVLSRVWRDPRHSFSGYSLYGQVGVTFVN